MDKYKLEMNGSNPEKTIESSHQLIIDTIKALMDIDSTSIITNIQLAIEHIEADKDVKEININEVEDENNTFLVNTDSIDKASNALDNEEDMRSLIINFLNIQMKIDPVMNIYKYTIFINQSKKLIFDKEANKHDELFDYEIYNELLDSMNIPFKIEESVNVKDITKCEWIIIEK